MYPIEWVVASIPLLIWGSFTAFCHFQFNPGRFKVNVLAILGAFLAFVSFLTGWAVIERGGDWEILAGHSVFLLFTYPVAVITPLAGIGQAGFLLWVLSYANQHQGSIEPFYGYIIAWISVVFMAVSIAWPVTFPRDSTRPGIRVRLLTAALRGRSGGSMHS